MKEAKVIIPDDMGTTIVFNSTGKEKWEVNFDATLTKTADGKLSVANAGGGLDCATIGKLPLSAWKKGTTVLGQQDGNCVRLVPKETLFQEIGVAMTADKLVADVGQKYHVVTTVTNSGEGTNEQSDLVITKPALGNYTIENVTTRASKATIEKIDDTHFTIKNIQSGGTTVVEFDVVARASGTFQFGANVNANTTLDLQSNNNQATITLSARVTENPDIVPSVDCPLMGVTYKGKNLTGHSNALVGVSSYSNIPAFNLIPAQNLKGVVLTLSRDCVVIIQKNTPTYTPNNRALLTNGRVINAGVDRLKGFNNANDYTDGILAVNYTQNGLSITINDDCQMFRLSVRPKGKNCKWQHFDVFSAYTPANTRTLTTTFPNFKKSTSYNAEFGASDTYLAEYNSRLTYLGDDGATFKHLSLTYGGAFAAISQVENMVVTLNAGQAKNGTVTSSTPFNPTSSTGTIAVSLASEKVMNVNVSSKVSTSDTFNTNGIEFKVV